MDAMVTARMPQRKKEVANAILRELGTNPSQFINDVYDYVIQNRQLPLSKGQKPRKKQDIQEALAFIDTIPLQKAGRFKHMTDDEIIRERLIARGHMSESELV